MAVDVEQQQQDVQAGPVPAQGSRISDDVAYLLPMGVFLLFIQIAAWWPAAYAPIYTVKTLVVAALLVALRRHYTKIRWDYWWLGAILGVIGIFQWIGMQHWLEQHFTFFRPSGSAFDPYARIGSPGWRWGFIAVRMAGAVLVVPVMEELFWRDYLWRRIVSPNDFKLASVGEWDWKAFLAVAVLFSVVHGNWWLTAIAWGLMIGGLLAWTRSLGACIVMHAVTNLLLGLYVMRTGKWDLW
jgi:CAAX prenyl protease-like protein